MKKLFIGLLAVGLTGCANFLPPPLVQTKVFDVEQAQRLMKDGKNTIKWTAFLRQNGGGVVTCAGLDANLAPATEYTAERMRYLYGDIIENSVGFNNNPLKRVSQPDPLYKKLSRSVICDKDGNFAFTNVADGEFFIVVNVTWKVGGSTQGGYLGQKVLVKNAETKTLTLTSR